MFTLPVSASLLLPLAKAVAATLRSLARRPRTGDETLAAMTSKSLLARPLARPGLPSPNDANKGASLSRNSSLAGVVSRPRRRGPATLGPAATRASPPPFGLIPYLVLLSCLALDGEQANCLGGAARWSRRGTGKECSSDGRG